MRRLYIIISSIVFLAYFCFGAWVFGIDHVDETVDPLKGQEFEYQLYQKEEQGTEAAKKIENSKLNEKIDEAIGFLMEKSNDVDPEDEEFLQCVYYSAFLIELGNEDKLKDQKIQKYAFEAHNDLLEKIESSDK
jgi:hypothetical protein